MPGPTRVFVGRQRVELRLGKALGDGTYGTVYRLEGSHRGQVIKIYNEVPSDGDVEAKIDFMVSRRPKNASVQEAGRTWHQMAWPTEKAFDSRGRFVGFLMPELDGSQAADLNLVFSDRERRSNGISGHYAFRLTIARNLAAVFQALHSAGTCILDVKPDNIRFYKGSGYICLIDCDSFIPISSASPTTGAACTPGYILPEAPTTIRGDDVDYDVVGFRSKQDDFALAVLIFRLMNEGWHPFSGIPKAKRLKGLTEQERIFAGGYPFGLNPHPGIEPPPNSLHNWFDDRTRELFDRAFTTKRRPTAGDWLRHLQSYVGAGSKNLLKCSVAPKHVHFSKGCGICAREQELAKLRATRAAKHSASTSKPRPAPLPPLVSPPSPPITLAPGPVPLNSPPPWAKIAGGLFALWALGNVVSCLSGGPPPRTPTSTQQSPQSTSPGYTVQYFTAAQTYTVAAVPGVLRVNLREGPGEQYLRVVQLSVGDQVTGTGITTGTDGTPWIAVTTPNGASGFIAERLLQPVTIEVPPAAQPSFSCAGTLTYVEQAICGDTSLAAKDREVAGLYQSVLRASPTSGIRDTQRGWLEERDRCGGSGDIPACLHSVYDSRLSDLRSRLTAPIQTGGSGPPARPSSTRAAIERPQPSGRRSGGRDQRDYAAPAPTITCVLPSGREAQLTSQECRQASGVIYGNDLD